MVLTVEYRIPLPLTADEYRIAQLYMLAKKSREESHGTDSGIEILVNEPYTDGPGPNGTGQYTRKVYHVGSHLPAWVKSLIPKSALSVEEEAWNAYPYTKTRFTCAFIDKLNIEIETYYFDDGGHQDNVFNLSSADLKLREVDLIDIVKDNVYGAEYKEVEDPIKYCSEKTGRGPLTEEWIKQYWDECKGRPTPLANGKAIMCAYKLCKVEFRYWGMQTKIEKFIHDSALRKTMLHAHRQAWAWMDEWWGLTIEDIRSIEKETQDLLALKYGGLDDEDQEIETEDVKSGLSEKETCQQKRDSGLSQEEDQLRANQRINPLRDKYGIPDDGGDELDGGKINPSSRGWRKDAGLAASDYSLSEDWRRKDWPRSGSKSTLTTHSQASWRMESIRRDSFSSGSEDEFFDCQEYAEEASSLNKWSSLEIIPQEDELGFSSKESHNPDDNIFSVSYISRVSSERHRNLVMGRSSEASTSSSPSHSPSHPSHHQPTPCSTTVLLLVVHAGSVLDCNGEVINKKSDVTTFRGAFESVLRQHYPQLVGRVSVKLVPVPPICSASLSVISSMTPMGMDFATGRGNALGEQPQVPVGALPILGTVTKDYEEGVDHTVLALNTAWFSFIGSEEGRGFCGQVCVVGDSVGGVLCYDALCRGSEPHPRGEVSSPGDGDDKFYSRVNSSSQQETMPHPSAPVRSVSECHEPGYAKHLVAQYGRRKSSPSSDFCRNDNRLDFDVNELFLFGCPLGVVLVYRKMLRGREGKSDSVLPRPACQQVYNLFHPTDPLAVRLEPLLSARFSFLPPVTIPRYTKYPLGDGEPTHLWECIQSHGSVFSKAAPVNSSFANHRSFDASITSTVSDVADPVSMATINALTQCWWGNKRLDYALYCPEGLANFPVNALPHLFHASYWESFDVVSFIIRQLVRGNPSMGHGDEKTADDSFVQAHPREKWIKKRTSVKIKNVGANHRGNDAIVHEGAMQTFQARFMYGPLDMVALSGEKVDVHLRQDPPGGDWKLIYSGLTDKNGRLSVTVPPDKQLTHGIYPVKMVVRGDHTICSLHVAVLPPKTQCIVFSIDGSFTASVSVTGKDPKVRAGAVDVVRHWQELGYLILYMTGRPDMQQQKVVAWLSQHNFPQGLVSFADGLSTDPLGHKADYLRAIIKECEVVIEAAYGSAKDIGVYTSIGLTPDQIYIVGKVNKKHSGLAQVLMDGYAAHLSQLSSLGRSVPARTNPSLSVPKGFFGLPGQTNAFRRRRKIWTPYSVPFWNFIK